MATSKESTPIIEKLNSQNYANWRFKVEMMLIRENLYEQITETAPDPVTAEWIKKDNRARALINLCIDDAQIVHIKHIETAKATLETLKNIHERSNLSSKLFLLRKLYSTKLIEGGNMHAHITKILEIVDKLRAIGEEVSDSHISAILLCSVPKSFDTLITALEARNEEELNSLFIRTKLVDEYNRRVENLKPNENNAHAFQINKSKNTQNYNTSGYNYKSNYNNTRKTNKFCTYCKKTSHNKSECWHLKNKGSTKYNKNHDNKSSLCLETNWRKTNERESEQNNPNDTNDISTKLNNFAFTTCDTNKNIWIFDSGSSTHISNDKKLFTRIYDVNKSNVIVANGQTLTSYGSGEIKFSTKTSQNEINNITLRNVLYVPEIQANLLSVKKATQNGGEVIFDESGCRLVHEGKTYLTGEVKDNLYEINFEKSEPNAHVNIVNECQNNNCIKLWHMRLGHRNFDSINQLVNKDLAIGLKINKCNHKLDCEICVKSKLTSKPYPKQAQHRATNILEIIHSDLCGPIKTPTIGGKIYLLTFIDDFSRYTTVYLLSHKSEVLEKLKEFIAFAKNKFGKLPQALRSDNGREYVNNEMENLLKTMGIKHQLSVPYSAPQNGVAERKNRSLMEMTRCLLNQAHLPHRFWGEAVNTANYLQNRLPTKINDKTPFEIWEKYRPNLSNLKLFGCKVYSYVDKPKRTKLDDRGQEGIFTGYDSNSKGYRVYTGGNNVTISRTVKFFEHITPNQNKEIENDLELELKGTDQDSMQNIEIDFNDSPEYEDSDITNTKLDQPRRSERTNKGVPPDRLVYLTQNDPVYEPKNWNEVQNLQNPCEKRYWLNAAEEEFNSLNQNKTWTLVDPPQGKSVIGSKWTFKAKYNSEGKIEKYKARLVAKGYSQKFGEDYDETFAPVVSHATIRTLLTVAAHKNLEVNHIDVKTAFLHGDLNESIFMSQPEGFITPGNENKVCKLQKAIYGLKQAARSWQTKIEQTLKNLNFKQSVADSCLYINKDDKNTTYIIIYVDDILIAGKSKQIEETVDKLHQEFEIKNLGAVKHYLGINIRKTEEGYFALNQNIKINEIINKFNLNEAKPCNTPMEPGYLNDNSDDNLLPDNKNYRQAIGALLYVATITRPDILAPVNILSRRNEKPRSKDWEQVKRIIKYLKTTNNLELILNPNPDATLKCYTDADWAGDKSDRKSTSGTIFLLGKAPVNWYSKKQSNIALSSAEAEYVSAAHATQEILWFLKLLEDLDMKQHLPIKIFEDNIPCIKMIEMQKYSNKTKHIDIKYHCIKDFKEKGIIDLHYCPSQDMIADLLTKPVPKPNLEKHRPVLQLLPIQQCSRIKGE